jgi:hypothetical protein
LWGIELVDLSLDDEMSSFGSQMTDEGSVDFIAKVADFSSDDEDSGEDSQSEEEATGMLIEILLDDP